MADPVTLPNGEVGIPANQAQKYYRASWDAGLAIIKSELYSTSTDYFAIFDKKSNDATVSYTHLDVYKRQIGIRFGARDIRYIFVCAISILCLSNASTKQKEKRK